MARIESTGYQAANNNEICCVGKKYNDIKDERLKLIFGDIDLNDDKQLSKDEIDAFYNYLNLKDRNYKKHQKLDEAKSDTNKPWIFGGISGVIGGIAGAIAENSIANKA